VRATIQKPVGRRSPETYTDRPNIAPSSNECSACVSGEEPLAHPARGAYGSFLAFSTRTGANREGQQRVEFSRSPNRPDMAAFCAFRPSTAASSNRMTPPHRGRPRPECADSNSGPPAARAEALAPTTCWCVCRHLHYQRMFTPVAAHIRHLHDCSGCFRWSVRRVGLAPTGKRRLVKAHTYCGHSRTSALDASVGPNGSLSGIVF
jgi:hypothetical protein